MLDTTVWLWLVCVRHSEQLVGIRWWNNIVERCRRWACQMTLTVRPTVKTTTSRAQLRDALNVNACRVTVTHKCYRHARHLFAVCNSGITLSCILSDLTVRSCPSPQQTQTGCSLYLWSKRQYNHCNHVWGHTMLKSMIMYEGPRAHQYFKDRRTTVRVYENAYSNTNSRYSPFPFTRMKSRYQCNAWTTVCTYIVLDAI